MMCADDDAASRKAKIDAWMQEKLVKSFYCPYLRATLTKELCGKRHVEYNTTRWFGNEIEAPTTPFARFCRGCKLGAVHAKMTGVKREKKKCVRS